MSAGLHSSNFCKYNLSQLDTLRVCADLHQLLQSSLVAEFEASPRERAQAMACASGDVSQTQPFIQVWNGAEHGHAFFSVSQHVPWTMAIEVRENKTTTHQGFAGTVAEVARMSEQTPDECFCMEWECRCRSSVGSVCLRAFIS